MAGQALGDGGLADAGVAHQQGIVLGPPAQDLDTPVDLVAAPDEGIDLTLPRLFVEVDAIGFQGLAAGLHRGLLFLVRRALGWPGLAGAGLFGDAVGDEVHRVIAGHLLLLQEIGGVALTLGEDRHQHIGAGHVVPAARLDVDHGALDHPLEPCRRLGVLAVVHHQRLQIVVDILPEVLLEHGEIDLARLHHGGGVRVIDQRQQQVLERGVLVLALIGESHRAVQGLFEVLAETRQT